jgi:hypothetical protein
VDDEAFAEIWDGVNGSPEGDVAATDGSTAAGLTAIEAAVPGDADVPDDETADEDPLRAEGEADGETEDTEEEEQPTAAAPEVIPISDARHPDHQHFLKAQALDIIEQQAKQQQAQRQAQARELRFNQALQALPDTDPEQLPQVVANLIVEAAEPLRQQAQQHSQYAEMAAGEFAALHLALKSLYPPEQVALIEQTARELGQLGTVPAMQQVIGAKQQARTQASQEAAALRQENLTLKKQLKALAENPLAHRAGGTGQTGNDRIAPAKIDDYVDQHGEDAFNQFFGDLVSGRLNESVR